MEVTVVVIDDNEDGATVVCHQLKELDVPPSPGANSISLQAKVVKFVPTLTGNGCCADLEEWSNQVAVHNPGVALVDMRLRPSDDDTSGVDLALRIKARHPDCCIVLMSVHFSDISDLGEFQDLEVIRERVARVVESETTPEALRNAVKRAMKTFATNLLYRAWRLGKVPGGATRMWALMLDRVTGGLSLETGIAIPHVASNSVVVKLISAGVCGTNHGALGQLAVGKLPEYKVIDLHEAFGQVVWTGERVRRLKPGDYVVPIVRRCNTWDPPAKTGPGAMASFDFHPCERYYSNCDEHPDECPVGEYQPKNQAQKVGYKSRGTGTCPGFASEYFVDTEEWLVPVALPNDPEQAARCKELYVLTEPLSIAWKALRGILKHRTMRECKDKTLIVGAGPIGLLMGLLLRSLHPRVECAIVDLVPGTNIRARIAEKLGITCHHSPNGEAPAAIAAERYDLIVEATDQPQQVFGNYVDRLSPGGLFMMIGVPEGEAGVNVPAATFSKLVKGRNVVIGSINSNRSDFEESITFLSGLSAGDCLILKEMITLIKHTDAPKEVKQYGSQPRNDRKFVKLVITA